jgi:aspartate aminotransferase
MGDRIPDTAARSVADLLAQAPPPRLSRFAQSIQGSTILQIAGEVREMQARGEPVLNLTVGDFRPDQFPIPAGLRDRIIEALEEGHTNYPPVAGVKELREALRDLTRDDLGLDYPLEGILVGGGARPLIYAGFMATVDPGDKVVYPVPSWNNHHYVGLSGALGVPLPVSAEKNFHLDRDDIAPHLADARLLVLNSPLNPTGTCIGRDALLGVAEAVAEENERRTQAGRRPLFLIYDQVYNTLTFEGSEHFTPVGLVPELAPTTILVDAVSKGLAGTGLRVGWAVGPPSLIAKMTSMAGHFGAWAPRAEQVATARFLRDRDALMRHRTEMNRALMDRLGMIHSGLTAMRRDGLPVQHIEPQGAIYLSARFEVQGRTLGGRRIDSNEDLRAALLQDAGCAVIPFEAFGFGGEDGWVRLSVGAVSVQEIREGLQRVRSLLSSVS